MSVVETGLISVIADEHVLTRNKLSPSECWHDVGYIGRPIIRSVTELENVYVCTLSLFIWVQRLIY